MATQIECDFLKTRSQTLITEIKPIDILGVY